MNKVGAFIGQKKEDFLTYSKETEKTEQIKTRTKEEGTKNVFAGDLNLLEDSVEKKRAEARKQAMQMIQNAWNADNAIDTNIREKREHYATMKKNYSEAGDEVLFISEKIEDSRNRHMVELDSQEQKDLELLQKREDYRNGDLKVRFEKEELERLGELDAETLSPYQEEALTLYKRASHFKAQMRDSEKQMKQDVANIARIQIERLKSHGMVDAQKNVNEIMESASKEIIGLLREAAVEKLEKEKEEIEKKEEEILEKKEKEQEKQDEAEIDTGKLMKVVESFLTSFDAQQSLEEIKNEMKLLEADLKGIQVDEKI